MRFKTFWCRLILLCFSSAMLQLPTLVMPGSLEIREFHRKWPRVPWRDKSNNLLIRASKEAENLRQVIVAAANGVSQKKQVDWHKAGKLAISASVCAIGCRKFGAEWVAQRAGEKFRSRAGLYLTIPAIAGLLNWATNKLAVWMIFNPQNFIGFGQRPGEPLGWCGWQGIVPAKVHWSP
jgi:hypothetical protein